jgi:hypothetical protein
VNLDNSLRAISSLLTEPCGLELPVGSGRWHILFGRQQRPLLMPVGAFGAQRKWLPHFVGSRLRALYAMTLLRLNAWVPAAGLLPELRLQNPAGATTGPQSVIQIGTTGPYQKASVLLTSESGEGVALAKVALVESADAMVAAEAGWLREIEALEGLVGQVPRLLAEGAVESGRRFLVTSLSPSARVTTDFTPAHADFLARLGRSRMEIQRFETSPCCESLERMFAELAPVLAREDAARLGGALRDCRAQLRDFVGPLVSSQGDFAYWNIRINPPGIFVFDWEYAQRNANPLADLFHFHLIQRAAAGRPLGRWFVASVLRRAQAFGHQHYPEAKWRAPKVSALALAYLLKVILQYAGVRGGIDRADLVVREYGSLIERRSAWMAS